MILTAEAVLMMQFSPTRVLCASLKKRVQSFVHVASGQFFAEFEDCLSSWQESFSNFRFGRRV